jgi:hypothetical protein
MNTTRINIIKKLTNAINLANINYPLIKSNSIYLYKLSKNIKQYWLNKDYDQTPLLKLSPEYKNISGVAAKSLIGEYSYITNELKKLNKIIKLSDSNISFYYLDLGNYHSDIKLINKLFNQSVCLAKYCKLYEQGPIIIIWIPVNKARDWDLGIINEKNLELSIANFNAFTASGVTYGQNPRITIVSRYEEIAKLLLHELIHNFNLDGSAFHEHNHSIINHYKKIKNPSTESSINNYDYQYSIYESYTELLSSYLSMIFRNININSKTDLIKRYETEILMEILYSYNTISNLINLNEYKSYEDFEKEKKFKGDICVYEYYYLKGLLYNNYELTLCHNEKDFMNNYKKIIETNKDDPLLKDIFNNMIEHTNFKYNFYD